MLDADLKYPPASGRRKTQPPTAGQREAARTIVQAICQGRPVTGVIADAGTTTGCVIDAALADLAARGTRIIRLRRTTVSCLGVASSMDRVKVGGMNGKGTVPERSRQVAECLQLIERPVPGETRRVLVLEEAEGVDPDLLGSLACMPTLDDPGLPLQLLCVGEAGYWDDLSACRQGALEPRIGSPIILPRAPEAGRPPPPGRVAPAMEFLASSPRATRRRRRVPRVLLAGLAALGCGGLLAAGAANQAVVLAFIQAHPPGLRDGPATPPTPAGEAGDVARTPPTRAGHPVVPDAQADARAPTTTAGTIEPAASSATLAAGTPAGAAPMAPRPTPSPNPGPPAPRGGPAPDPAAMSRLAGTALGRGDAMLAAHDVSAARLYYELAADAGSADAALALGRTYDPTSLIRSAAVSAQPDKTLAARWYRRAAILGSDDAERSLRNLERQRLD